MSKEIKNNYDDLKVVDCWNGKVLIVMNKETWKTITNIIQFASDIYMGKRKETELL